VSAPDTPPVDTAAVQVPAPEAAQGAEAAAAILTPQRDFRAWLRAYDIRRGELNQARWPQNAINREKHSRR
jgi:hypothetical protein